MNFKRFFAVFRARNIEFFRDRSSLGWNLLFPILMLVGLSFVFSGDGKAVYKVGVVNIASVQSTFIETRYVEFIYYEDKYSATLKLEQHAIDFLVDFSDKSYWVNQGSPNSYLIEKIFIGQHTDFKRLETNGKKIRYVDWVLPGILGMNMMFSCLFGVGYVIVR
ncbi:MAG: ABC transporter permease, partial [Colwellia sp.]